MNGGLTPLGEVNGSSSSTAWFEHQPTSILLDFKCVLKTTFALTKEGHSCGLEVLCCCCILLFRSSLSIGFVAANLGYFIRHSNFTKQTKLLDLAKGYEVLVLSIHFQDSSS